MEHIVLNITDRSKIGFLMEILKRLEFVEIVAPKNFTEKEHEILDNLESGIVQVKKHKLGQTKLRAIQDVLNEL